MVYINSEGTVGGTRRRRPLRFIADLISGIFDFVGLFFRTLTANPATLQAERVSSTRYRQPHLIIFHIATIHSPLLTYTLSAGME